VCALPLIADTPPGCCAIAAVEHAAMILLPHVIGLSLTQYDNERESFAPQCP
jgi:hypothetical protein